MSDDTLYMVWRDLDPKFNTVAKVNEAYGYYHETRGVRPNVVLIHPETMTAYNLDTRNTTVVDHRLQFRERSDIQRNHFYVGVE